MTAFEEAFTAVVRARGVWRDDTPADLLDRWAHLPEWPQLLLRAILFRLAANALDPKSTRAAHDGLRAAARDVSAVL